MTYVLSPGASIAFSDDSTLTVRLVDGEVALRGRTAELARRILCTVEQPKTVEEVAKEAGASAAVVARVLAQMEPQGLVTTVAALDRGPGADRAANTVLRLFPDEALCTLGADDEADVVCLGDEELGDHFAQLTSGSIRARVSPRPVLDEADAPALSRPLPSLAVSLRRERDEEHLRLLDRWARRARVPYLAGWFEGVTAVVTHVVVPLRTACYECLCVRERAAAHGSGKEETPQTPGHAALAAAPTGRLPAADGLLANMAALRAVNVFAGRTNEAPAPTLLQLSFTTLKLTRHPVLRVPMCESCGHGGQ